MGLDLVAWPAGIHHAAVVGPGGWVAIEAGASHLTPPQSGVAVRADLKQTGSRTGSDQVQKSLAAGLPLLPCDEVLGLCGVDLAVEQIPAGGCGWFSSFHHDPFFTL